MFDASYVKSDNIRFSSTYKNVSSVEQLYFSISGNADTVWLSSIVWKLCLALWSKCIIQNIWKYISFHYRQNEEHLPLDYRFFNRFHIWKEKRIIFTAPSAMKTMRSASLMKQYSFLISNVLKCTKITIFALGSLN